MSRVQTTITPTNGRKFCHEFGSESFCWPRPQREFEGAETKDKLNTTNKQSVTMVYTAMAVQSQKLATFFEQFAKKHCNICFMMNMRSRYSTATRNMTAWIASRLARPTKYLYIKSK